MKLINPIILIDCDGVLLDWIDGFRNWMKRHGESEKHQNSYSLAERFGVRDEEMDMFVSIFNESASIRYLKPLEDAQKYVNLLYHRGYVFRVITSFTNDEAASLARLHNIQEIFGKHAINGLICLSCGKSKKEALEKQAKEFEDLTTFWIEDHTLNAVEGEKLGFETIVKAYDYNKDYQGSRFSTWKEIYDKILEIETSSKVDLEFL